MAEKGAQQTKVLVAVASKHGSTQEIAERIWRVLCDNGINADFKKIDSVNNPKEYSAFVLGSAVYVGNWMDSAKKFIDENSDLLKKQPVWLFSSGPIGEPAKPSAEKAVQINEIIANVIPKEHHLFNGKIDKNRLSFGEKAIMLTVGAKEGDYRNWQEIEAWAIKIATDLKS